MTVNQVVGEKKTYAVLVLDESGSMATCSRETVSGYNEQVQTIKSNVGKEGAGEWFGSLVKFNQAVSLVVWNQKPSDLEKLTQAAYSPNGGTAMLDAVGTTIAKLKETTDYQNPDVSYLVIIVSDGDENSSRNFTYSQIGESIQELQGTKRWTFVYMGANQDLSVIQKQMHIPSGNTVNYTSDGAGTAKGFEAMTSSTRRYMSARSSGATAQSNFAAPEEIIPLIKAEETAVEDAEKPGA